MMRIGITGGIGSGKTTVCKVFELFGIPVYHADEEGRRLSNNHPIIVDALKGLLGDEIYTVKGLNRSKVASMVFNNPKLLEQVNAIIHPVVTIDFEEWYMKNATSKIPFALKEAAILFESGSYKQVDKVITVVAPLELRIQRVIRRDQISREKVMERISNQWDDPKKIALSDYVIQCDDIQMVIPQVITIFDKLQI
jgi:dephospho-CoA kinase